MRFGRRAGHRPPNGLSARFIGKIRVRNSSFFGARSTHLQFGAGRPLLREYMAPVAESATPPGSAKPVTGNEGESPESGELGPLTKGRVLLVDDEPLLLKNVARILRSRGYTVECAADGTEAKDKLASGKFD